MRFNFYMCALALLGLSVFTLSSCGDDTEDTDKGTTDPIQIRVDDDEITFGPSGEETHTVTVLDAEAWTIENETDWLSTENTTTGFTITAGEYNGTSERSATIRVVSENETFVTVNVLQDTGEFSVSETDVHLSLEPGDSQIVYVKYGGDNWDASSDDSWIIIDIDLDGNSFTVRAEEGYTDEVEARTGQIVVTSQGNDPLTVNVKQSFIFRSGVYDSERFRSYYFTSISDNGRYIVGESGQFFTMLWDTETNEQIIEENEDGSIIDPWRDVDNEGNVALTATTPDGTVSVYFRRETRPDPFLGGDWNLLLPTVTRNGVTENLPYPETAIGGSDYYNYVIPHAISADGKTIYGRLETNLTRRLALIWKLNEATDEYEWSWIGEDQTEYLTMGTVHEGDYLKYFEPYTYSGSISHNGRYVTGAYMVVDMDFNTGTFNQYQHPYVYDIETEEFTILDDIASGFVTHVMNDGTYFVGQPYKSNHRTTTVHNGSSQSPLATWIGENFGFETTIDGTVVGSSADGNVIIGYSSIGAYQPFAVKRIAE